MRAKRNVDVDACVSIHTNRRFLHYPIFVHLKVITLVPQFCMSRGPACPHTYRPYVLWVI